jgi:hypothetical protein
MTTASAPTLRLGARAYPVVLPNVRDPRLHLAGVIITIHVLGQTALGFRVSVPQIVVAILTCAAIEVIWSFYQSRQIVWPASAMLTGSGVALILRLVGMERGDHWSWEGWHIFAAVAGLSLLTKYVIRYRGSHVFNPSNVGLVAAFLLLGSEVIEPLDFWWAPLDFWMAAAYLVILVGGLLITRRLRLLTMAAAFWTTLVAGIGVLALSGHCMTAAWALQPVCGSSFWWVIATSPEVLIFLFFMITDPKTIPEGGAARVAFAICLALVCVLLIAPHTTEFGAKVGLLGGLVVLTPLRLFVDRMLSRDPAGTLASPPGIAAARLFARGALLGAAAVAVGVGIVAAGAPARDTARAATTDTVTPAVDIDPSLLPPVTVTADARAINADIDSDALAVFLAEALAIEADALLTGDTSLLRAADDGERLLAMERKVEIAATRGEFVVPEYSFDSLHLDVVFHKGPQGGASLGLEATGTVDNVTYDAAGLEQSRESEAFATTFVLSQGAGGRWLIVAENEG